MPIKVECDDCGARFQVADHALGKSIKCQSCGERISVAASQSAGLPPRTISRGSQKSSKQTPHSSSSTGLVIGGIIGSVVVVVLIVVLLMRRSGNDAGGEPLAANTSPAANDSTVSVPPVSEPQPNSANRALASPSSGVNATPTNEVAANSKSPSSTPPSSGFQKPTEDKREVSFTRSANWTAKPDPPSGETVFVPAKPLREKLNDKFPSNANVVFPVAPSSLVAIQESAGVNYSYKIYDAVTGRKKADVKSPSSIACAGLSEDGSYLAVAWGGGLKIDVWDVTAKKSLGTLDGKGSGEKGISELAVFGKTRMVGLSQLDRAVRIWELPSGTLLREIKGGEKSGSNHGFAFSPGGRFLAITADYLTEAVAIYDLETGELAGMVNVENKPPLLKVGAMGFSRDGAQLAFMYDLQYSSRFVVWDLQSGEITSNFEIEPTLKQQLDPVYQSCTLESFPDTQYWLLHSLGVIDTASKQLIYGFPKQNRLSLFPSRRVLSETGVISVSEDRDAFLIEVLNITREQFLAGANIANAGGLTTDINLPPLTAADFTEASYAQTKDAWTVQSHEFNVVPSKESIRFSSGGTVRELVMSRSDAPVIAVRIGIEETTEPDKQRLYESLKNNPQLGGMKLKDYEPVGKETEILAYQSDGTKLASFKLPYSAHLWGISPDGKQALVEEHETNGRIDVYEISNEGKHVVGWRPYRVEIKDPKHRDIYSARFLDRDHVATLSMNNVLVVWDIADFKPVWKLDEVIDFCVSTNGSTIVAARGNILGLQDLSAFDSLTGAGQGNTKIEGHLHSMAVHPNGKWLALSQTSGPENVLRIFDITSGTVMEEYPLPVKGRLLAWAGDDHLLLDGSHLVSRELQAVVWRYDSQGVVLPLEQMSSALYVAQQTGGQRGTIHAVDLPREREASQLDPLKLKAQAILSPGDTVTLKVEVAADVLLQPLQSTTQELIGQRLADSKKSVAGSGAVNVTAKLTVVSHGPTEVTRLDNRSEKETVARKSITINITYSLNGKPIWLSIRAVGNLDGLIQRVKPGESIQQSLDNQMVENFNRMLSSLRLPTYIFGENAKNGLGSSKLIE